MNRKVLVAALDSGGTSAYLIYHFIDGTGTVTDYSFTFLNLSGPITFEEIQTQITTAVNAFATLNGFTVTEIKWSLPLNATASVAGFMSAADKTKLDGLSAPAALSFTHNASRTIQTVAAAANGFQLSSTRASLVNYSVTVATTVQIGIGTNVSGYVALEIAPTNSSTAGDWIEIGRTGNSQNIGLALALSSAQSTPQQIGAMVPAGYYTRLRSVDVAGTPTYTYNSGQEVLL